MWYQIVVSNSFLLPVALSHLFLCAVFLAQFTGSSLTSGKEPLKRPDDEDAITKQNKKRPRPILLQHMSPLLKVNSPFRRGMSRNTPVHI